MPIYEYKCNNCNKVFEVEHSVRDVIDKLKCPYCLVLSSVEKLISLSSFKLSWVTIPHPGVKTPVKQINGQIYDEKSYNAAKAKGMLYKPKRIKFNNTKKAL